MGADYATPEGPISQCAAANSRSRQRRLRAHRGGQTDGSGPARGPFFRFARRWVIALGGVSGLRCEIGAWTGAELGLAAELTAKYTGDEWTRKR
ncbi:MAG: hypothetical protein JSV19_13480 [Phycisphaerales bacterium]|nr:MAG: hypothetical protein JSV19_13480 [Phycisphaerales bacterium]